MKLNATTLIKKLGVTAAISAMTILGAAVYSSANAQTPAPNPAHKGTHKGPHKEPIKEPISMENQVQTQLQRIAHPAWVTN